MGGQLAIQPESVMRPTYFLDSKSVPWANFDGANDFLRIAGETLMSKQGAVFWTQERMNTTGNDQVVVGSADESVDEQYLSAGSTTTEDWLNETQEKSQPVNRLLAANLPARTCVGIVSNGESIKAYVNGQEVVIVPDSGSVNDGRWFGDIEGRTCVSLGALLRTAAVKYMFGLVGDIVIYDRAIDQDTVDIVNKQLIDKYKI